MDECLDNIFEKDQDTILFGSSSLENQPVSPLISTRYMDAHQRDERDKRQAYEE